MADAGQGKDMQESQKTVSHQGKLMLQLHFFQELLAVSSYMSRFLVFMKF